MQYSDHLARKTTQHHNARNIPRPVVVPQAVTLRQLTPLVWNAGNNQHAVSNLGLNDIPQARATDMKLGQVDPAFATWHLRDYMVV
jgi:hypothetical protein